MDCRIYKKISMICRKRKTGLGTCVPERFIKTVMVVNKTFATQ